MSAVEALLGLALEERALARGTQEVMRALERGRATIVVHASDAPSDLVDLITREALQREVPLVRGPDRERLGALAGIQRPATVVSVGRLKQRRRLAELLGAAEPDALRTLSGLQRNLPLGEASRDTRLARMKKHHAALVDGEDAAAALGALLQETIALANAHGVDLQAALDRRWLSVRFVHDDSGDDPEDEH